MLTGKVDLGYASEEIINEGPEINMDLIDLRIEQISRWWIPAAAFFVVALGIYLVLKGRPGVRRRWWRVHREDSRVVRFLLGFLWVGCPIAFGPLAFCVADILWRIVIVGAVGALGWIWRFAVLLLSVVGLLSVPTLMNSESLVILGDKVGIHLPKGFIMVAKGLVIVGSLWMIISFYQSAIDAGWINSVSSSTALTLLED